MITTEEKTPAVSNEETPETVRKIYKTPVIREYGSINDLVQGSGNAGFDGGILDDVSGSF